MQDPATDQDAAWTPPDWPVFGQVSDVRPAMARASAAGRPMALATLHAHEGAAPLGEGAQILFDRGFAAGFLSGGCVEGDVALHARAVLEDGQARRLVYGRGGPPDIRLLCGARIEVLVERVSPDDTALARLLTLGEARRPALWLSDGSARACLEEGEAASLPQALQAALDASRDQPVLSGAAGDAIYRRHPPRLRLVVVGADPITLSIAATAVGAGFETVLVRPKGPAAPPPLQGVAYLRGEPAEAFAQLALDPWTAVAVATHDIDSDHAALLAALPSRAGYVGALGSRRRLSERLERLAADGLDQAAIARLKAPIGLRIGARTPGEIAASVVAEAIQALKG